MKLVALIVGVVLVYPAAAGATTTSAFNSGTLSVMLSGSSAAVNVSCGSSQVLISGANPGTGPVSCSAVHAISVTGGPESDAIGLAGVTASTFSALTSVSVSTGGGNDNYFGSGIGDTVDMGAADTPGGDVVTPGAGNDHITCPGGCQVTEKLTGMDALSDTSSVDSGTGGGGTDTFSGTVTAFDVVTSGTNPTVNAAGATVPVTFDGYGSGQMLTGGSGNDSFTIHTGSATINGGSGANSLAVTPAVNGNVTLTATTLTGPGDAMFTNIQSASITEGMEDSGNNVYDWSSFPGPVVLSDVNGADTVNAGPGNDSITLYGGAASVNAGGGDDQIYLRGNPTASDSVDGGSGSNTLTWSGTASGTITATNSELATPDGTVGMANIGALTLLGTNGDDVFDARAFSGPVTIAGEGGQDVMLGGPGADSFTGFSGSTDCFNGGPGADAIDGGGSATDTDVVDPADTLVSGSTYTPVSTCGDGDGAPTGSTSTGGSSGSGGASADSVPPAASAQISAWGTRFSPTTYGGSVSVVGFATDPAPSSGTPAVRCALDPATVPASYDTLPSGACTQTTTALGPHTFYVAARDPAGNTSAVASVSFTVVAVPDTLILGGPTGGTWAAAPEYSFIATVPGSTFACSVDGGPPTACVSPRAIGPFAPGSAHTFTVVATSPAGFSDPTPAVADFTVNPTQVTSNTCEITPRPVNAPVPPPSVALACMFRFAIPADCGANYRCIHSPDGCPAQARCTLTTKSAWTDGDSGDGWIIPAWSTLTSTTNPAIVSGIEPAVCDEPDDNRFCSATKTSSLVGPATMEGQCDPVEELDTSFGSDADRDLKCSATVTVTPAVPLSPITSGDGIDLFVPGGGKLILVPLGKVGAARSAAEVQRSFRRAPPLFARTTRTVTGAGVVRFIPKLSRAAKASLKRHRRLTITVRATFLPTAGGPRLTHQIRTTLTTSPRRRGSDTAGGVTGTRRP